MIILLLCSAACLFVALIISMLQRILPAIAQRVDVDPLDPISYSRGPL